MRLGNRTEKAGAECRPKDYDGHRRPSPQIWGRGMHSAPAFLRFVGKRAASSLL